MGLFDKLFPPKNQKIIANTQWQLLNGYTPIFTTWQGELYESELVRASIDSIARHSAKLRVGFVGSAQPELIAKLRNRPNDFQGWYQLLYRLSTILQMQNTAFLIPILDRYNRTVGITTMLPQSYDLVEYNGEPWIRFTDFAGQTASIELSRVCILTRYQYKSDLFGSDNSSLNQTMNLINLQNQSIEHAISESNSYRFWAKSSNLVKAEDLKKERKRFSQENFSGDNSGLLLFPNIYSEVHQIDNKGSYTIDYNTMELIKNNVFSYFGTNEKIIQNRCSVEELDSFFNGCIEPFLIQLQEGMTKMLYTNNEIAYGNRVVIDSNRLQYMTTSQKVSLATALSDRGCILIDEVRELFNYPALPNNAGQVAPVRGEFKSVGELLVAPPKSETQSENNENEEV